MAQPLTLAIRNANLYTPIGSAPCKGAAMGQLLHVPACQIEIAGGRIAYVGPERPLAEGTEVHDLQGRVLLPGFVDPHTHIPFTGNRADEFTWRLRGDSYMSIMERGGGIVNTMKAVRSASAAQLLDDARRSLAILRSMGVTTVEGKSGYGLDLEAELKQLSVLSQLGPDVAVTFLGAHAVPPEFEGRPDDYINYIITEVLPRVKEQGAARFCDIFCERGVFTVEQSRRLLLAAKEMGFDLKVHADEIYCTSAAELAAEVGAASADHLLHVSDAGIRDLAASQTVAVLLPMTAFCLNEQYAPARKMIDAGCAVALGTDYNPGSCRCCYVPLMIALACINMRMTLPETITAMTLNSAAAVGLAGEIGSVEAGKWADLAVFDTDNINDLVYCTAFNLVCRTYKRGECNTNN